MIPKGAADGKANKKNPHPNIVPLYDRLSTTHGISKRNQVFADVRVLSFVFQDACLEFSVALAE